jgi:hypothetical protein
MSTLTPNASCRKYRRPSAVDARYQVVTGAATLNAAHQRALRVEREFFQYAACLRLAGCTVSLVRLRARFEDETADLPAPDLTTALREDGQVSRAQDAAREDCLLDGASPEELDRLEHRTRREIANGFTLLQAIAARRAVYRP